MARLIPEKLAPHEPATVSILRATSGVVSMPAPVYREVTAETCGVYAIVCLPTGQKYIGGSTRVRGRWYMHRSLLRREKHWNIKLSRLWSEFGENKFQLVLLEKCDRSILTEREQHYIDLTPQDLRLNICERSDSTAGTKRSEESREKIVAALKSRPKELIEKIAAAQKGKKKHSEEHKRWISQTQLGRKHSEESKKKMSLVQKGRSVSADARKRIGESRRGKKHTEETKRKISEASKMYWQKRKSGEL